MGPGFWLRGLNSVVKLLGVRGGAIGLVVCWQSVICDCLVLALAGLVLGRQAAWRPGCNRVVLS